VVIVLLFDFTAPTSANTVVNKQDIEKDIKEIKVQVEKAINNQPKSAEITDHINRIEINLSNLDEKIKNLDTKLDSGKEKSRVPKTALDLFQLTFWAIGSIGAIITMIGVHFTIRKVLVDLEQQRTQKNTEIEQKQQEIDKRQKEIEEKQRDLTWRKAGEAEKLLKDMNNNRLANEAMLMLDWNKRYYLPSSDWPRKDPQKEKFIVDTALMCKALRAEKSSDEKFQYEELYIRDCFDEFFYYLARIQHAIDIDLIEHKHIIFPTEYYIKKMATNKKVFVAFLEKYDYSNVLKLLNTFSDWKNIS
jgi:DNA repair exonuclease SbcCD ATPase subunit